MASAASSSCGLLSSLFSLLFLMAQQSSAQFRPMNLTVVNDCLFPLWPAIQPNAGGDVLEGGGFFLPSKSYRTFPAPISTWSGRVWARTGCGGDGAAGRLSCDTGDCGGRLACDGLGGEAPASLAQISLHGGENDLASYDVSLVDGFNVGMTVAPHEGEGRCPAVGCLVDLLATCPEMLQLRDAGGAVVGCKSGCAAFGTDELCCRNNYNSPAMCRPSSYSKFFKQACPATLTYAGDSPSPAHECAAPRELKVIFCR